MENRVRRFIGTFIEYMIVTYANKLVAIALIGLSCVPILLDGDATIMIFMLIVAIPLFFSKRNWII